MTDAEIETSTVLKILSGLQSGVEVSLAPGYYTLGSGHDDDIQIIDISLAPHHLELRINQSGIQIRAAAGSIKTANGIFLDVDSDWQEIEPLDILTAGTTRFALGSSSAKWTSIADIDVNESKEEEPVEVHPPSFQQMLTVTWENLPARNVVVAAAAAFFAFILGAVIWYWAVAGSTQDRITISYAERLQRIHTALSPFAFAKNINVTQEVDGAVYVSGYVDSQAERRAILHAVDATHSDAFVRIWVLDVIRQEINGLISAKAFNITFKVSDKGEVTLEGLLINDQEAEMLITTIREEVPGVSSVISHVRTGSSLLTQANELADNSQVKPWVMLHLEKGVIEATGAVPAEKVDSWLGFLQAYARRLAPDIGLRSFVQLQDLKMPTDQVSASGKAIVIGAPAKNASDTVLDIERILHGDFAPDDVLIERKDSGNQEAIPGATAGKTSKDASINLQGILESLTDSGRSLSHSMLADNTRLLLQQWRDERLQQTSNTSLLLGALKKLSAAQDGSADNADYPSRVARQKLHDRYLPAANVHESMGDSSCWQESVMQPADALITLFWLDLLSLGQPLSLANLDTRAQLSIMEAALNPRRLEACIKRAYPELSTPRESVFLQEIGRNPDFIRFILRDMPSYSLDISGANPHSAKRFIQTRDGQKIREGASSIGGNRLVLVGELGAIIEIANGLATTVYGKDLTWIID